jgi:hypothetical protein
VQVPTARARAYQDRPSTVGVVATVEELFRGEFDNLMKLDSFAGVASGDGSEPVLVPARVYFAFDVHATFLSYHVPEELSSLEHLKALIHNARRFLESQQHSGVQAGQSHPEWDPIGTWSQDLPFTGRVILYVEAAIDDASRRQLTEFATSQGLHVQFRDKRYEEFMNAHERPAGFISHDSRDKPYVEQLAGKLRSVLCPVWYDAYSLKPGDSLTQKINAGLRDSKRCVVVLSPNFFSNTGWGQGEFNAIMNRQFAEGGNILIPIWHNVTRDEVAEYSPLVVDTVAINTNEGFDEVFRKLHQALIAP